MGVCVEKISHSCGTRDGLQVFENEDGTYNGYCFSCGKFISNPYEDRPNYKPTKLKKSKEDIEKELNEIALYKSHSLPDRLLSIDTISVFSVKVGVSEVDGVTPVTHYYPYYKDQKLQGYKVRLIENKKMWGVGDTSDVDLFGWDLAIQAGGKKIYITEGEIDCLSLYQIFKQQVKGTKYEEFSPAVVSLPHGAGSAARDLAKSIAKIRQYFKEVVLVFDMDEAGRKATEDVLRIIPDALVASLPAKDVNECLMQGRAKACYNACVFNAKTPKNTRLVIGTSLAEKAKEPPKYGVSWPWKHLTKTTRGIRLGETIYIGAAAKLGKSEVVNTLAAHFIQNLDWKVLLAKPEEANVKTVKMVAGKLVGKIFHDPNIEFDSRAFDEAIEQMGDRLLLLNLYQHVGWDSLKADIREAASEGCKAIFIDPISNLTNGMSAADANSKLQEIAQELAAMALDLNIVIFIMCHLKSPDAGPPHDRGGEVLASQFFGSRAMERSCHLMLGIEGNKDPSLPKEQKNVRTIVLISDREFGESGRFPLYWDDQTGEFNEL